MAAVIKRVDRLEEAIQDFITNVGIEFNKLYNAQMRAEAEMHAFMRAMGDLPLFRSFFVLTEGIDSCA